MAEPRPTLDFSLPNVSLGPDPWSLSAVATEHDFVVVYLQRDHLCTNCRKQVQQVAKRYADFRERRAEVVSVVPEPREKVRDWQDSYDLPYPLLADPDIEAGDLFDQRRPDALTPSPASDRHSVDVVAGKHQRAKHPLSVVRDRHEHAVRGDAVPDGRRVGPEHRAVEDVHHVGQVRDGRFSDPGHPSRASSIAASRSSTLGRSNVVLLR